jgi:hypothetical protein
MFFLNFDVVKFVVVTLSLGYYVCNIGPEFCLYYLTTYVMVNGRRMVVGVAAVVILGVGPARRSRNVIDVTDG